MHTACPSLRRCNAPLTLRGVLRLSVTERPVFLFHLDKTDEHLGAEIQALMQSRRNGLVEGALLIDRSTFVKRQLNDHAVPRPLDAQIIGIDDKVVTGM